MIFLTMVNKVEVSHKTILFTVLFLASLWIIFQIRDILLILFVAFILTSAISPIIDKLEKKHITRPLAILIIYIFGLAIIATIVTLVMPPLINETVRLASRLPEFINSIFPQSQIDFDTIFRQIIPVGTGVVRFSVGIFSNVLSIITLLVITFYFLLERKKLEGYLTDFIGNEAGKRIYTIVSEIEMKLGAWVRGEFTLMTIIGLTSYLGLTILKVDYALPLAIFAGFLEIVPIIGPIISAIPAVLVAFATSPGLALVVAALYTLIQQLENSFIVPTVMKKAVGLPPLVTILALMIGGRLAGVGGAMLSVPIVLVLQVVAGNLLKLK